MDNRPSVLNLHTMKSNIGMMVDTISGLKMNIIKALIHSGNVANNEYVGPQLYVISFVDSWNDIATGINSSFTKVDTKNKTRCVSYDTIRGYINTSHDFAAVLPFAHDVFKCIKENKFTTKEEIDNFYEDVITKAFNDIPTSVGGLMDSVLQSHRNTHIATKEDIKVYNSVSHRKLFNDNSSSQLKNSIKRVTDFIINRINSNEPFEGNMELYVYGINKIFDFIIYSLAAYAVRINVLGLYVNSFISTTITMMESVLDSRNVFTILTNANDMITRDLNDLNQFLNLLKDFISNIGAQKYFPNGVVSNKANEYIHNLNTISLEKDKFISSLLDNELFDFVAHNKFYGNNDTFGYDLANEDIIVNDTIKALVYGDGKGTSISGTSKQDLLNTIVNFDIGDTSKELCISARDIYIVAVILLHNIVQYCISITANNENSYDGINRLNIQTAINATKGTCKILRELYQEVATCILAKGREIEARMNEVYNDSNNDDIIGDRLAKLTDDQKDDTINLAFVDVSDDKVNINEFYEYPYRDEIQILNEFIKANPLFKDDAFLFEDGTAISGADKLIATVKALWQQIKNFFSNAQFTRAADWVAKYSGNINELKPYMSGMTMEVLPYKDNITLPDGVENALKNIGNIPDQAFTDKNAMDAWVQSLYPNGTYQWFKNNKPDYYKNMVLFQDKNYNDDKINTITLKNDDVASRIDTWINNISSYNDIYRQWSSLQRVVDNSMTQFGNKVKAFENKYNSQNKQNQTQQTQQSNQQNTTNKQNTPVENPPEGVPDNQPTNGQGGNQS